MKLTAKAFIQIQKLPHEVFDAIINPLKMNRNFIASSTRKFYITGSKCRKPVEIVLD